MSGHGGNIRHLATRIGCKSEEILDFSANINPQGPPEYIWNVFAAPIFFSFIHFKKYSFPNAQVADLI